MSTNHPNLFLIVHLWTLGGVAGAIMHTNDMLEPLGGLHMSGWVAEGAGCTLGEKGGDPRKLHHKSEIAEASKQIQV
eukprot:8191098-Pyramimonas_sp.AAC.3